ncbi:MAG: urease accessory protein UreE [Pseudomonadota bacterium]
MSEPLPRAVAVLHPGAWSGAADAVSLDYAGRFLRRRRLTTEAGRDILADLPETVSLEEGDALRLEDGGVVAVRAAPEDLVEVRGANLPRLAWHIGNRHFPCEVGTDRLVIRRDPVIEALLMHLGAVLTPLSAPFRPEGGAYGHGPAEADGHDAREHGHDHGHGHLRVHTHVSHGYADEEPDGEA